MNRRATRILFFLCVLLGMQLFPLPGKALAARSFTLETVDSRVIMGEGSGTVTFRLTNTGSPNEANLTEIRIDFYVPGAAGCFGASAPYDTGAGTVGPPGWTADVVSGRGGQVTFTAATDSDGVPPGGFLDFEVVVTGFPNAEVPIQSDASDMEDYLCAVKVTNAANKNVNRQDPPGPPVWPRLGLKAEMFFATPQVLGVGGLISLDFIVTNRSTAPQSLVVPGTMSFPPGPGNTGGADPVSGPDPATVSLDPVEAGTFSYVYEAASAGTVTFANHAANGMVSSQEATSNTVTIGDFSASLSVDPVKIGSGYDVLVSMNVFNNGTISLGNVVPWYFATIGTAATTLKSGPTPTSIASLPAGSSGTFQWVYTVSGNPGDTYQFEGSARASGPIDTETAISPEGQVTAFTLDAFPETVAAGSVPPDWTLSLTVVNQGSTAISRMWFIVPDGFIVSGGGGPGSPLGDWEFSGSGNNWEFRAASAGGTGQDLPVGGTAAFYLTFSAIPNPTANTPYEFQAVFREKNFYRGTASDSVLVTVFSLGLNHSPAGPIPADGSSQYTVNALLTSGGVPVSGKTVSFSATIGALSSSTAVTNQYGIATVFLTAPASGEDIQSVVTAGYLGSQTQDILYFTGWSAPTLLYLGGTLDPAKVGKGKDYDFSLQVMNQGSVGMDLDTSSYFTFTDGGNTYLSYLSGPVSVPAGATVSLGFDPQPVADTFSTGSFYPALFLSDGGTNDQTRDVSDPVEVLKAPLITHIERTKNPGDIKLIWEAQPGKTYNVYFQDSFEGTWGNATEVYASGNTIWWVDDGSETGSHPLVAGERYYKVAIKGTSVESFGTVGEFCKTIVPGMQLISLPFEPIDADINEVLSNQLTGGFGEITSDRVWKWDPISDSYRFFWYQDSGGFFPGDGWKEGGSPSNETLEADEGFWIQSRQSVGQTVCFVGQVSKETNRSIPVVDGMQLFGHAYPKSVDINDSDLINDGFTGGFGEITSDRLWVWDTGADSYHFYWYQDSGGFFPGDGWKEGGSSVNFNLEPGTAYWLQIRNSSFPWTFPKPYENPPN